MSSKHRPISSVVRFSHWFFFYHTCFNFIGSMIISYEPLIMVCMPHETSRVINRMKQIRPERPNFSGSHTFPLTVPARMLFSKQNENRARSQVSWEQGCRWAVVHAVPIVKPSINRWGHDWWHWCKSSLFQAPRWWWKVRWKLKVVQ